jgi:hypothetical protein
MGIALYIKQVSATEPSPRYLKTVDICTFLNQNRRLILYLLYALPVRFSFIPRELFRENGSTPNSVLQGESGLPPRLTLTPRRKERIRKLCTTN